MHYFFCFLVVAIIFLLTVYLIIKFGLLNSFEYIYGKKCLILVRILILYHLLSFIIFIPFLGWITTKDSYTTLKAITGSIHGLKEMLPVLLYSVNQDGLDQLEVLLPSIQLKNITLLRKFKKFLYKIYTWWILLNIMLKIV